MKQITEEQINEAAIKDNELAYIMAAGNQDAIDDFKRGAQWMQEQLQPEWIPVSERLPDVENDMLKVIGWNGFDCVKVNYFKYKDEPTGRFRIDCLKCFNEITDEITHWQPLPSPPEQ